MPYSPSRWTAQGRTRLRSRRMAYTIYTVAQAGAYQALGPTGPQLPGDEGTEAGGPQTASLAHQADAREAGVLSGDLAHGVHGVGEDDDVGFRRNLERLLGHAGDDAGVRVHQVLAAHARLAGHAGGDDDDVGAGGALPVGGAADADIGADDGAGGGQVQGLAPGWG